MQGEDNNLLLQVYCKLPRNKPSGLRFHNFAMLWTCFKYLCSIDQEYDPRSGPPVLVEIYYAAFEQLTYAVLHSPSGAETSAGTVK